MLADLERRGLCCVWWGGGGWADDGVVRSRLSIRQMVKMKDVKLGYAEADGEQSEIRQRTAGVEASMVRKAEEDGGHRAYKKKGGYIDRPVVQHFLQRSVPSRIEAIGLLAIHRPHNIILASGRVSVSAGRGCVRRVPQ